VSRLFMGIDPWVGKQYFLKWRGRPVFCPPTFSGIDIFVLRHTVFLGRLKQFSLNIVS